MKLELGEEAGMSQRAGEEAGMRERPGEEAGRSQTPDGRRPLVLLYMLFHVFHRRLSSLLVAFRSTYTSA